MLIGVLNNYCDEELMRYRANIKLLFYIRRYEQYREEKIVSAYIANLKEKNLNIDEVCNLLRAKVI